MSYIIYNNILYGYIENERDIYTFDQQKAAMDATFEYEDFHETYHKNIESTDPAIQAVYTVRFFAAYDDNSETIKQARQKIKDGKLMFQEGVMGGLWCVNEGIPNYRGYNVEKNELGIGMCGESFSEDWVQYDRSEVGKIVNLYDCTRHTVQYTYKVKDGKKLVEPEIVDAEMSPDAFKEEMIKHRYRNL